MAIVKFGSGVAEMRNKVGGMVFSRNQYGSYQRTKVTPINPQTSAQSAQRATISTISKAWGQELTEAQRTAWNNGAQFAPVLSIFGDVQILNGIAWYLKLNLLITRLGLTRIDDPPAAQTVDALLTMSAVFDLSGPTFNVTFTPTPVPASHKLVCFSTPALPAGRSFAKSDYRLVTAYAAAVASPKDIYADWSALFGVDPVAGQKVGIKVFLLNTATGATSVPFSDVVVAIP